ncbi:unnamed protein product, partial [Rotaria sp. Silwood1]
MFANVARKYDVGLILESPTWRASPDWMRKIGYADQDVATVNRKAIELLCDIRKEYETENCPIVINACVGPRGDAYNPTTKMSIEEAQAYHATQIGIISQTNADMITALAINYPEEAIGIAKAAKAVSIPVVISFIVGANGDSGVGKSSLISRFVQNEFSFESRSTIGVEFLTKQVQIDDKIIKVQIWDTAGQERFKAITKPYYRYALGALLVYDIMRVSTFQHLDEWYNELTSNADNDCCIILVGNKVDQQHIRVVSSNDAKKFADQRNM